MTVLSFSPELKNTAEKTAITAKMTTLEKLYFAKVTTDDLLVPRLMGSSLDIAHENGRSVLRGMMSSPEFMLVRQLFVIPESAILYCDTNRNFYMTVGTQRRNLAPIMDNNSYLSRQLDELSMLAENSGGCVYAGETISVDQWHSFHGIAFPEHLKRHLATIKPQRFPRAKGIVLGNYMTLLDQQSPSSLTLTDAQRSRLQPPKTLDETMLYRLLDRSSTAQTLRVDTRSALESALKRSRAKSHAHDILNSVEWYGSGSGQTASEEDLNLLLMARILLDINPTMGQADEEHRLFGFDLYYPGHVELNRAQVLRRFEEHLIAQGKADALTSPVVAHLLLATCAPECVIKDVPDSLPLGSTGWATFMNAAAYVETLSPGACCVLTYNDVMHFADSYLTAARQDTLYCSLMVKPMLNWAAMNNLIPYSVEEDYNAQHLTDASAAHDRYIDQLTAATQALSTPLPTRESVARKELERVIPNAARDIERKSIREHILPDHAQQNAKRPFQYSALDLYQSDDLLQKNGNGSFSWNFYHDRTINWLDDAALLKRLGTVASLFPPAFDSYYDALQKALNTNLRVALSRLPMKERIAFEYGAVYLYLVRKRDNQPRIDETPETQERARARYGVVISSTYKGHTSSYELFTIRAQLQKQPALDGLFNDPANRYQRRLSEKEARRVAYMSGSGTTYDKDELWSGARSPDKDVFFGGHVPMDEAAYFTGSLPRNTVSAWLLLEKDCRSLQSEITGPTKRSPMETFNSPRVEMLFKAILERCPVATRDELYDTAKGISILEAQRQQSSDQLHQVLNLIIPFKGCIEDITSGDPDREAAGALSCVFDGMAVMGAVLGAAPKMLSIAARTGSASSKAFSFAKAGSAFVTSLINPLDGMPDLVNKGSKLLHKGNVLLSKRGRRAFSDAVENLRQGNSVDESAQALKALTFPDVKRVQWLGRDDADSLFNLLIIKRGNDWYSLDMNTLLPRGPKLSQAQLQLVA
ncbi:hypothetical protein ACIOYV_04805 [Pseudomonas sp. NPDC087342]|uniref:hypothetical protein n=1 Tax=Pseudomonas sp. NPDC087342 TaxID=3364437 RepID=UPI003825C9E0